MSLTVTAKWSSFVAAIESSIVDEAYWLEDELQYTRNSMTNRARSWTTPPVVVQHDRVELAAYAALASVLLNMDETIVKE